MVHKSKLRRVVAYAAPLWLLLGLQTVNSADIAYEVRQGSDTSLSVEMGLAFGIGYIPIVGFTSEDADDPIASDVGVYPVLSVRAQWRSFFVEAIENSFNGVALGYALWENDHTKLDLIVADAGFGSYDPGIGSFESLQPRDGAEMAGVRSTLSVNNTLVQLELYSDVSDVHDGQIATLHAGRFWQIRNWNVHSVAGLRFFSDKVVDHYFGISEVESTANIPTYQASGGTLGTLELGATLPLSEHWVFRTTAEGYYIPAAVTNSPLADGRLGYLYATTLSYVFQADLEADQFDSTPGCR